MKKFACLLCISLGLLQGCSQQAAPPESSQGQAAAPSTNSSLSQSEQLFTQAKAALDQQKNPALCMQLLDQAAAAARREKNADAVVVCTETAARLKIVQKNNQAAQASLESLVHEMNEAPADSRIDYRMDGPKSLLASLYATGGNPDKAEAIYKDSLEKARKHKPIIHKRLGFWLKNYSDFLEFSKRNKESALMKKEALAELKK
ncbi:MAG: hypothetical protein K2X27_25365 [Candidatus Obscuribacterales bacterium]|nr:hypothetical protein [Candidatus Obscuribacterales bacterium]